MYVLICREALEDIWQLYAFPSRECVAFKLIETMCVSCRVMALTHSLILVGEERGQKEDRGDAYQQTRPLPYSPCRATLPRFQVLCQLGCRLLQWAISSSDPRPGPHHAALEVPHGPFRIFSGLTSMWATCMFRNRTWSSNKLLGMTPSIKWWGARSCQESWQGGKLLLRIGMKVT